VRRVPFAVLAAVAALSPPAQAQTPPALKAFEDALARHNSRKPTGPTLGEFAACAKAADEPICLLKLATRSSTHRPYAGNIRIAYAPEVLAAVGEKPPAGETTAQGLHRHEPAAIAALLADRRGEPPERALAPIRAITPDSIKAGRRPPTDGIDAARMDVATEDAARHWRRRAYQTLWEAAYGPFALPAARRPSRALVAAVLDGWEAEVVNDEGEDLIKARVAFGDLAGAARAAKAIASHVDDEIHTLIAAGLLEEATTAALRAPPAGADGLALTALAAGRRDLIEAADKADKPELATAVARAALDRAGPEARFTNGLDLGSAARHIARHWRRTDATRAFRRLETTARKNRYAESAAFAAAAAIGWRELGETRRADRIVTDWSRETSPREGCKPLECVVTPAVLFQGTLLIIAGPEPSILAEGPLKDSLEFRADMKAGRADRLGDHLARAGSPDKRQRALSSCVEEAAGDYQFALARICARQLEGGGAGVVDDLIYAASAAAEEADPGAMKEFMAIAYRAAAAAPEQALPRDSLLPNIAIGQLRAQGRL